VYARIYLKAGQFIKHFENTEKKTTMKVVALVCVVCIVGVNGAIFTDSENREIAELIETTLQCRHIPGMTLAVVKGMPVYVCLLLFVVITYYYDCLV